MSDAVTTTIDDDVAVIRIDDGKANALSHGILEGLHLALDQAEAEASSIAIIGREGKLSAGFDLATMTAGPDSTRALVKAGAQLMMRLYGISNPVTVAVTGHALAAGALLALSCDTRIGASDVNAKIGLNEVAIGMALPVFAVELARDRLDNRHFQRATMQAELYDPAGALEAGYLDRLVPLADLESTVIDEARRLGTLRNSAYRETKLTVRQRTITHVLETLDEDLVSLVPPIIP